MGFALSWFAVMCSRETAMTHMGLEPGVEVGDTTPDRLAVAELPDGWLLFMSGNLDEAFMDHVTSLSQHGPAVACAIEEHVMFHEARGYAAGTERWRVTHDPGADAGIHHLEVAGDPPQAFEAIHQAAVAQQDKAGGEDADVDFVCEAPVDLAMSICGFRHDIDWPEGLTFRELRRPRQPPKDRGPGLFQRLFGRS
ncbi:hypothetical protein [Phenylobacterium sp.]|uniref:hypothetical protein n=1 Tax=Phenylobacterium sp. TaxID=1871053 RepID=UPI0025DAAC7D|nr:hypothetical protein [Phenylobacterium sp.]